jgi:hypothetical protein
MPYVPVRKPFFVFGDGVDTAWGTFACFAIYRLLLLGPSRHAILAILRFRQYFLLSVQSASQAGL